MQCHLIASFVGLQTGCHGAARKGGNGKGKWKGLSEDIGITPASTLEGEGCLSLWDALGETRWVPTCCAHSGLQHCPVPSQPVLGPGCTGSPSFLPCTACFPPTPFCFLSYIVTPSPVPQGLQLLPLKSAEKKIRFRWWSKCGCKSLQISESEGPKQHLQNLTETIPVVGMDEAGSASSGRGRANLYICRRNT